MTERAKVASVHRIVVAFRDSSGAYKTGLTVTLRIRRKSDGYYLKNDGTWTAAPSTEYTFTETDSTNLPGFYHYDFTLSATVDTYYVRADGSATLIAANRYQEGELIGVAQSDADLGLAIARLINKSRQIKATGVIENYADDGTTVIRRYTMGTDTGNPQTATEIVHTPSTPA